MPGPEGDKVIRVNMSDQSVAIEDFPEEWKYQGGRSLSAKILLRDCDPGHREGLVGEPVHQPHLRDRLDPKAKEREHLRHHEEAVVAVRECAHDQRQAQGRFTQTRSLTTQVPSSRGAAPCLAAKRRTGPKRRIRSTCISIAVRQPSERSTFGAARWKPWTVSTSGERSRV